MSDDADINGPSDALKDALGAAQAPLYAVLDGAKFDDLPDLLFDNDFSHKPLYRDMGSEVREVAQTTPQFVRFDKWDYWENALSPAQRLDALLEIVDDTSAAVFWECEGEPKRLFRHLRTINNVMIPRDADTPPMPDPLDPEGETFGNTATHQQVLFRHADANVMAQVLPVLSPKQLTRFMGPAQAVIFAPEEEWLMEGEVVRIENPKDTYNPNHPLKLSGEDMDAIEARRANILRYNVMSFLRDMLPDETEGMIDKDLYDYVVRTESSAEDIGISSLDGLSMWAYLSIRSNETSLTHPKFREYFGYQLHPNDALIAMSKKIIDMNPVRIEDLL